MPYSSPCEGLNVSVLMIRGLGRRVHHAGAEAEAEAGAV